MFDKEQIRAQNENRKTIKAHQCDQYHPSATHISYKLPYFFTQSVNLSLNFIKV
ncbi:hypothetical protein EDWATA_03416 [Edwardsiella tarda ATCC 23685]|uniref:Uncharacterized protein n=1 Tax=Edwardsiella tarda ATCC 23685 TaxID=500638 RepID=D4F9F8_EDWTA|nr:hypothetical protein EDWATA_03416 [Edwardsiella tarda ATCC 23685]